MPGAPIRVRLAVRGLREREMCPPPVLGSGRTVGGGSDQWMGELHAPTHVQQPGIHRREGCSHIDVERLRRTMEQQTVADGLRGSGEHEQLRVRGQQAKAADITLLDFACYQLTSGQPESTGEICGPPGARQLEERERVSVAFADDLVADRRIERPVHIVQQQRPGIAVAESLDGQLRQPGEDLVADARTRGAHQRDPLGEQATADKGKDLCGGLVEPLRVVHDADQRLLLGGVCQEAERR